MIKSILRVLGYIVGGMFLLILFLFVYVNIPVGKVQDEYALGVTFSTKYAKEIGLDWKETYIAMLDDLGVQKVRIPAYWDEIEAVHGQYDWSDLDWQIEEAKKRDVELIVVLGRKVPRWPECFFPQWAQDDEQLRKSALLQFMRQAVERYKDSSAISLWQIENEPFLKYGLCPPFSKEFFDTELSLVRTIDPSRNILTTDSGELGLWLPAARRADVFGTTMYRNVYTQEYGAYTYPIGPRFFHIKLALLKRFAGDPRTMVVELQGEPWLSGATVDFPVEEQLGNLNAETLEENVLFAREAGFSEIYLWGVEWWYWMKTTQDNNSLWEKAQELFSQSNS